VIPLPLSEIARVTNGSLDSVAVPEPGSEPVVTGPVTVDSRTVSSGGLFVAVPGERVDGHDFAPAAVAAGAAAVLVARPVGVPAVVVPDPVMALGKLARAVLDRLSQLRVVAVTGSSGKTGTKDLLSQVLIPLGPVVAPPGSYNNEIGLPLTALRADTSTRTMVAEMGARGVGHISYLCEIAPPDVAVVLNVGVAHIGEFGTREAIARAKGELVAALPASGVAVLNADDPLSRRMTQRTAARVVLFGTSTDADVRADDVQLDDLGRASFRLVRSDGIAKVALRVHGAHQVSNALAVAAVAQSLGLGIEDTATGLSEAQALSRWRMEFTDRPDGVTVINDAYNANPDSVRAALTTLAAIGDGKRRTWAVIGEMRELGDRSFDEHAEVGRLAVRLGVDRVVAVGEGARAVNLGASHESNSRTQSTHVPDTATAVDALSRELQPGDVVLVKASRASGLEVVAEQLLANPAAAVEPPA
jgi:UDP-N-acetylmuramoyl-tripeptide--D-alanyl-D-alanine ligase